MGLSSDILSQFAKATKDDKKTKKESVVYGTAVEYGGKMWARLDGADEGRLTPISTTADVKAGERVTIMIKDHQATVTGNLSSPAPRSGYTVTGDELKAINGTIENLRSKVGTFESMSTVIAEIEKLQAKYAELDTVNADTVRALYADIEKLEASIGEFTDISAENLDAMYADIQTLRGYTADFTYVSADILNAQKAAIKQLDADKISADSAELKYVNIDCTNIDQAWIDELVGRSSMIETMQAADLTVTKKLVGVWISGDMIEGNTIKADSLMLRDPEDGLYYKLNFDGGNFTDAEQVPTDGLHGSIILAESITTDKIHVTDLSAFGATIGGFHITGPSEDDPGAIYSVGKETVDNDNPGVYLDSEGQVVFGGKASYFRYCKVLDDDGNQLLDEDGKPIWKLRISADSVVFSSNGRTADELSDLADQIQIGSYNNKPAVELSEEGGKDKLLLTNENAVFVEEVIEGTEITRIEGTKLDKESVSTNVLVVGEELRQGNWVWATRNNGRNYGLMWKEVTG